MVPSLLVGRRCSVCFGCLLLSAVTVACDRSASEPAKLPEVQAAAKPEKTGQSANEFPERTRDEVKSPSDPSTRLAWAEVIEMAPDPTVVTDAALRDAIVKTGLPWRVRDKGTMIELLLIPPGEFVMGKSPNDHQAEPNELPAHEVVLTEPFYLGRYEVTQQEYSNETGRNPSVPKEGPNYQLMEQGFTKQESEQKIKQIRDNNLKVPVNAVTWWDCIAFCKATNLRLPTEAEWEYACRAGQRVPRYGSLKEIAWGGSYDEGRVWDPQRVGMKKPNALGLYDMLGNVNEWVNDKYGDYEPEKQTNPMGYEPGPRYEESAERVMRGGSYEAGTEKLRSSSRLGQFPDLSGMGFMFHGGVGFRVAKTP
jgi:formylglycine-generating enzyme required for sulfatase activity